MDSRIHCAIDYTVLVLSPEEMNLRRHQSTSAAFKNAREKRPAEKGEKSDTEALRLHFDPNNFLLETNSQVQKLLLGSTALLA